MIDMRIKTMFFDRPKVQRTMDAAQRRSLSRAGAFIRTRARTSMRRRKWTSKPGRPPHAHDGSLRWLILFGYDRAHNSVVVGPVGFAKSKVPRVLEFGGRARIVRRRRGKRDIRTVQLAATPT